MTSSSHSAPNTNSSLTDKWEATGLLQGLDPNKKESTAILLEQVLKYTQSMNDLHGGYNHLNTVIFPIARLLSEKKDGLSGPELVNSYCKWYAKEEKVKFTCFGNPASIDQEKYLVDKFVAEYLAS